MKLKRTLVSLYLALAIAMGLALAPLEAFAERTKYPLSIKDALGRTVVVKKAPKRLISIAPSVTEVFFALGLGSKVVGVTTWCDYPADVAKKEKIGSFSEPNIEKIAALQPDLIVGAAGVSLPVLKKLEELGFTTIVSDARDVKGVKATILDIAEAADALDEARELIASMEKRFDRVVKSVKALKEKPKVFYEVWNDPLMTAGPGTFIDDLIELAGGVNVAGDAKTEWPVYSLESLVHDNPDIIIYSHFGESPAQVRNRKGWETIKAIKSSRIVKLPDENIVSRPGPRIVDGLEDFARAIHPELFK